RRMVTALAAAATRCLPTIRERRGTQREWKPPMHWEQQAPRRAAVPTAMVAERERVTAARPTPARLLRSEQPALLPTPEAAAASACVQQQQRRKEKALVQHRQ